jgi:hypothetical protein
MNNRTPKRSSLFEPDDKVVNPWSFGGTIGHCVDARHAAELQETSMYKRVRHVEEKQLRIYGMVQGKVRSKDIMKRWMRKEHNHACRDRVLVGPCEAKAVCSFLGRKANKQTLTTPQQDTNLDRILILVQGAMPMTIKKMSGVENISR